MLVAGPQVNKRSLLVAGRAFRPAPPQIRTCGTVHITPYRTHGDPRTHAARGWSLAQAARVFLVEAQTIAA